MNILLINHYAGSPDLGMEFRPYYMAKEWQKAGHHVRIVGGSFSHLRKKQPCEYREIVDNVEYCWIPVNRYKREWSRKDFFHVFVCIQTLPLFCRVFKEF